jgi:transposase-like protein
MATQKDPVFPAPDDIQRWTAGRKSAVVMDLIKGKTTSAEVARQHGLIVAEVETWLERFMEGGREFLHAAPRDAEARFEAERKELHAKIGEQAMAVALPETSLLERKIDVLETGIRPPQRRPSR